MLAAGTSRLGTFVLHRQCAFFHGVELAMARVRFSLKWLLLAITISCIVFWLLADVVREALVDARRTGRVTRITVIASALQNYKDTEGCFPSSTAVAGGGRTRHSWRVLILPFLEEDLLYDSYDFSQTWNSSQNRAIRDRMPRAFALPGNANAGSGHTNYVILMFQEPVRISQNGDDVKPFVDCNGKHYLLLENHRLRRNWLDPRDLVWNVGARGDELQRILALVGEESLVIDSHWTVAHLADLSIRSGTKTNEGGESDEKAKTRTREPFPKTTAFPIPSQAVLGNEWAVAGVETGR
jgi:hypothetical protein